MSLILLDPLFLSEKKYFKCLASCKQEKGAFYEINLENLAENAIRETFIQEKIKEQDNFILE